MRKVLETYLMYTEEGHEEEKKRRRRGAQPAAAGAATQPLFNLAVGPTAV
jgi:hypothetical protein